MLLRMSRPRVHPLSLQNPRRLYHHFSQRSDHQSPRRSIIHRPCLHRVNPQLLRIRLRQLCRIRTRPRQLPHIRTTLMMMTTTQAHIRTDMISMTMSCRRLRLLTQRRANRRRSQAPSRRRNRFITRVRYQARHQLRGPKRTSQPKK